MRKLDISSQFPLNKLTNRISDKRLNSYPIIFKSEINKRKDPFSNKGLNRYKNSYRFFSVPRITGFEPQI